MELFLSKLPGEEMEIYTLLKSLNCITGESYLSFLNRIKELKIAFGYHIDILMAIIYVVKYFRSVIDLI